MGFTPDKEHIKELAILNAKLKELPTSEALASWGQEKNIGELFKKLGADPFEIGGQLMIESMAQFLPAFAWNALKYGTIFAGTYATYGGATTGGAAAIPSGIVGFGHGVITAAGITSWNMEYTAKLLESFEESGVDITNAMQLYAAFLNEELMVEVKAKAAKKAAPIAVLDAISGGLAGKIGARFKSKLLVARLRLLPRQRLACLVKEGVNIYRVKNLVHQQYLQKVY